MNSNLDAFNDGRSDEIITKLRDELLLLRKSRASFRSIGLLAAAIQVRTGVHRTTLLRNASYRRLLSQYQRNTPGAAASVQALDDALESAQVVLLQAQLADAIREKDRVVAKADRPENAGRTIATHEQAAFANACVLLCEVLARCETMAVDMKKGELVDLAASDLRRVVASGTRASQFLAWLVKSNHPAAQKVPRL